MKSLSLLSKYSALLNWILGMRMFVSGNARPSVHVFFIVILFAFFIFKRIFWDISPFCGATDTPVLDFWWCLVWVLKPEWAAWFAPGRGICACSLRFTSWWSAWRLVTVPHMHLGCWIWTRDLLRGWVRQSDWSCVWGLKAPWANYSICYFI